MTSVAIIAMLTGLITTISATLLAVLPVVLAFGLSVAVAFMGVRWIKKGLRGR